MACVGSAGVRSLGCGQSLRSQSHAGVDMDLSLKLGCESVLDVELPCAVDSQWQRACGATSRLLRSCGSVLDQELAACVAYHPWFGVSQ